MNFMEIGRYKANADARCSFVILFSGLVILGNKKTKLNHFKLKSFIDWFTFTEVKEFK